MQVMVQRGIVMATAGRGGASDPTSATRPAETMTETATRMSGASDALSLQVADHGTRRASNIMDLLGPTFTDTPWVGWVILLVGIFMGLVGSKIVQAALRDFAGRMKKRQWEVRASLVEYAAGPASLAVFTAGLRMGLNGLTLGPDVRDFVGKGIGLLYIVAIGWFLFNMVDLVDLALRRVAAKHTGKLDDTLMPLIRKSLRIFLLIMMSLFVAKNTFGWDITAWLAGLGIAGLAISLAAQDSVKNVLGSVMLLIERPFSVGDRVIFQGFDGVVESIGFRSTRVRTANGHLVTLPNMKFTDSTIENVSVRPYIGREINLALRQGTAAEKVREAVRIVEGIFEEAEIKKDMLQEDRAPRVYFDALKADSLNIKATYWYALNLEGRDWWGYNAHGQEINLRILEGMKKAGIELALPAQAVHILRKEGAGSP